MRQPSLATEVEKHLSVARTDSTDCWVSIQSSRGVCSRNSTDAGWVEDKVDLICLAVGPVS